MAQVIVVGSVNADYSVRVEHLPEPGETVTDGTLATLPGGKGANQAHAAARLGAAVTLVAAVGTDPAGEAARTDLAEAGIDISTLLICDDVPNGVAVILVDAAGENMIAVAPGANARLTPGAVSAALADRLTPETVLLASLEIPVPAVTAAAQAARAAGATLVVNPAPGRLLPDDLIIGAILTPNEGEVLRLTPAGAEDEAIGHMLEKGARAVVVTRGGRGATLFTGDQPPDTVPAPEVEVVDTVGAGDAFNGALATALALGLALRQAVAAGVEAGALACTGAGARAALPHAADVGALRPA